MTFTLPFVDQILQEDNLDVLKRVPSKCVDLVYIDPPFGTGNYQQINSSVYARVDGYSDKAQGKSYFEALEARLVEIHRILKDNGSLYLHIDYRNSHHIRYLLDTIFGINNLVNEIIWAYDYGGRPKDRWPKKHDNIYWYRKSDKWIYNYDDIDRIPYMAPGLVGPTKAALGKIPTDVWWMIIVPTNGYERTGYPNQKPEKLLERIIRASSNVGSLVADFYCGSGTTGAVAQRLGRHYLLVDNNKSAIDITKKRLGVSWRNFQ